jgi:uncharacterized repeat protein (TIGR02543 family)
MKFYNKRTVAEQLRRLPYSYQDNYKRVQLDRIKIDGEEIQGYFEYSFLEEKSYVEQPTRAIDGSIGNIDDIATILTPRLIIKYNMMHIDDYRILMKKLKSKNSFNVTCYDIVEDKMVTHEMYAAPTQMPIIYQQYLKALGIQEFTIEFIGTNNDSSSDAPIPPEDSAYIVTYDLNIPNNVNNPYSKSYYTQYTDGFGGFIVGAYDNNVLIGSSNLFSTDNKKGYKFKGWLNDTGTSTFKNGDLITISSDTTLTAMWTEYTINSDVYTLVMHVGSIYNAINSGHKFYYEDSMQLLSEAVNATYTKTSEQSSILLGFRLSSFDVSPFGNVNLLEEDPNSPLYHYIRWKFKGWSIDTNSPTVQLQDNWKYINLDKPLTIAYMQWETEGVIDG